MNRVYFMKNLRRVSSTWNNCKRYKNEWRTEDSNLEEDEPASKFHSSSKVREKKKKKRKRNIGHSGGAHK